MSLFKILPYRFIDTSLLRYGKISWAKFNYFILVSIVIFLKSITIKFVPVGSFKYESR